jgi:two-component system, cell cycle response regulator DivK
MTREAIDNAVRRCYSKSTMDAAIKRRILAIDDNKDILALVVTILQRHGGYEVISTTSGSEGLRLARAEKPDVVILDIEMPDMSGDQVSTFLSQDPATSDIPVIFLTGLVDKTQIKDARRRDKRFVIAKPVTVDELLAVVKKALS